MSPLRELLFHLLTILLLATAYLGTLGQCADDPGAISFTYPQAADNNFAVGDTIEIAWRFPNPGQHSFDLDLELQNGTVVETVAKGIRTTGATTTYTGAFNYTIPEQLNNKTILSSNASCQFTIRSSNPPGNFDLHPSRSPIFFLGENASCHHQFRSAAGNTPTGCTEKGSSVGTADRTVSFAALVVALSLATVLLG